MDIKFDGNLSNLNRKNESDNECDDNFKMFDYELTLKHSEDDLLVEELLTMIGRSNWKDFSHMPVVIANLLKNYSEDQIPSGFSKSTCRLPDWCNHFGLIKNRINSLMALLTEKRFVVDEIGEWDWENGKNRLSRICATEKLMDLARSFYPDGIELSFHPDKETILLRNKAKKGEKKGKIIEYTKTKNTIDMGSRMKRYNRLIGNSQITLDLENADPEVVANTNFTKTFTFRVFNEGSFKCGGRGYGGWWQEVPNRFKKQRQHILINDDPTVEIDFCNQHLVLLYAREGLHYGNEGVDGYELPIYAGEYGMREATKSMFTKSVNCWSIPKTTDAFLTHYEEEKAKAKERGDPFQEFPQWVLDNPRQLMLELKDVHSQIAHYLCKGKRVGLYLQYVDSMIADEILRVMTKKKIPVLSVHDSFICAIQQKHVLIQVINDAYAKIVKKEFGLEAEGILRLSCKFQGEKEFLSTDFGMAA